MFLLLETSIHNNSKDLWVKFSSLIINTHGRLLFKSSVLLGFDFGKPTKDKNAHVFRTARYNKHSSQIEVTVV